MHKFYRFCVVLWVCGLLAGVAGAETFHLTDGQTVSGEMVSMDGSGFILKQPDGSYGERIPWAKLGQADIKELVQNPKAAQYVEPFLEPDPTERQKRTEVEVKEFPRMNRPAGHSLIAAIFTSPMGLFIFLVVYAGNIYAAYEISVFRAQPTGMVCGVAAVAPIIGPIIYLSMPTKLRGKDPTWQQAAAQQELDAGVAAAIAAEQEAPAAAAAEVAATPAAAAAPAAPQFPPAKVFARGQYTFNRRFFETQMPAFFAVSRPEAEKDKILTVKSSRGQFIAQRIVRVSANDVAFQIQKGAASEEVVIPFVEIQEVQLKHKDAP